jgi:hypothetical protein
MIQLPRSDQPLIPLDGTLNHPILQSSTRTQQRKASLMKNIQQAVNGKKENATSVWNLGYLATTKPSSSKISST